MSKNARPNYSDPSSRQTSSQSLISRPTSRPPSELLCDLHVYKVPPDLWRESFNNILNNHVTETVSIGIIRVPTEIRLVDIREEIVQQLGENTDELVPKEYVFLRSVGRSLTTLRGKQEYQLKAKHFIPPVAYAPELYVLEATPEVRAALAISNASSQSPPPSRQTYHRSYPNTYRRGHVGLPETDRSNKPFHETTPPGNKYKSLPHIGSDPYKSRDTNKFSNQDPYNPNSSSPSPHSNHQNSVNYPHKRYNDPYHHNNKNNANKSSLDENRKHHESDKPGSDWDEQPENKQDRTSPLKLSPPQSPGKGRSRHHNDNGVTAVSPDDDHHKGNRDDYDIFRKARDLQKTLDSDRIDFDDETEEERRQRLEDLESRNAMDGHRWNLDQDERKRLAIEDRLKEEERKREKEEEEMRRKEERKKQEEEKRREEAEKKKKHEEDEKRREEEKRKIEEERSKELERIEKEESDRKKDEIEKKKKDDLKRKEEEEEARRQKDEHNRRKEEERLKNIRENETNLALPHLRNISPEQIIRDTESARQRRRDEKNQLLKDIEEARQGRHDQEKIREELVRKAKQMQHKTTNRRNEGNTGHVEKKYFEEKKKTAPLEENSNRLRGELEILHKRLVNTLEGPKEKHLRLTDSKPSEKNNYVIQSAKLQHEIEDLQRRVENARMKLTAEMKLRNQAQCELRALRAELTQRTQSIELNRQHQLASINSYLNSGKENITPSEKRIASREHSKPFLDRL